MRIKKLFEHGGHGSAIAFMPYVCCGDPSAEFTLKLVRTLIAGGADAIEFGIPFSDPIADGKTIQTASSRALKAGMTPSKAIGMIKQLRSEGISVPIIVMTYYNIVYANGVGRFLKNLKESGADGLIVPDVPLEESKELHKACEQNELDLIYLITPNCPDERLKKIAEKASGFLYVVAVLGTTGAREQVAKEAIELIHRARKITRLPLAAGFGISKPEHGGQFAKAGASGVIVASRLIDIYSKYLSNGKTGEEKALREIAKFTVEMKKVII